MIDSSPAITPADHNIHLFKDSSPLLNAAIPYRQLTGRLLYLSCTARPDIAAAVGVLIRFNSNPRTEHWTAAKGVLRYLKGTINYHLRLQCTDLNLTGFADANWASDIDNRRSTTATMD